MVRKKKAPIQSELFPLFESGSPTTSGFKESLRTEFVQSIVDKDLSLGPRSGVLPPPPRPRRKHEINDQREKVQTSLCGFTPISYPDWAFPDIARDDIRVFDSIIWETIGTDQVLGLDYEFGKNHKATIIGIAHGNRACAVWNNNPQYHKLLAIAHNEGVKFVGHNVLASDKLVFDQELGSVTDPNSWGDTMITHYLSSTELAKSPGKETEEGALGLMGLGFATARWTTIPAGYKNHRGVGCIGPCPKCDVLGYCSVDAYSGLKIWEATCEYMREKAIPWRIYLDRVREAVEICLPIQQAGLEVDWELARRLDKVIEEKKEKLFDPVTEFNPKSSKQAIEYFRARGLELKKFDIDTIRNAVDKIADRLGYENVVKYFEDSERPSVTGVDDALMRSYQYKDAGKGTDPWYDESKYRGKDDRIHPRVNYCSTSTLRYSGSAPNFQNLAGKGWGQDVKKAILPDKGMKFLSMDAGQLEVRTVLYAAGIDPRTLTVPGAKPQDRSDCMTWLVANSNGAFDEWAVKQDKKPRDGAKMATHASNYLIGFSPVSRAELGSKRKVEAIKSGALGVFEDWEYFGDVVCFTGGKLAVSLFGDRTIQSRKKALNIQKVYFGLLAPVRDLQRRVLKQAEEEGLARTGYGSILPLIADHHKNAKVSMAKIGQGMGAEYCAGMALKWRDKYPDWPLKMLVHDEILACVPESLNDSDIVDKVRFLSEETCDRYPTLWVPWSTKVGPNWGEMRGLIKNGVPII